MAADIFTAKHLVLFSVPLLMITIKWRTDSAVPGTGYFICTLRALEQPIKMATGISMALIQSGRVYDRGPSAKCRPMSNRYCANIIIGFTFVPNE